MQLGRAEKFDLYPDEDGYEGVITLGDGSEVRFQIGDPEQLYDEVKKEIGPWLYERDMASSGAYDKYPSAYEISDPKHPDFHSIHVDLYDNRPGK